MKSLTILLLAVGTAVMLTSAARADQPLLSPRAKANQANTALGISQDKLDRSSLSSSPKARDLAYSMRKVSGTTEDRLDRSLASTSPKDRALHSPSAKEYQVAPLK